MRSEEFDERTVRERERETERGEKEEEEGRKHIFHPKLVSRLRIQHTAHRTWRSLLSLEGALGVRVRSSFFMTL